MECLKASLTVKAMEIVSVLPNITKHANADIETRVGTVDQSKDKQMEFKRAAAYVSR